MSDEAIVKQWVWLSSHLEPNDDPPGVQQKSHDIRIMVADAVPDDFEYVGLDDLPKEPFPVPKKT